MNLFAFQDDAISQMEEYFPLLLYSFLPFWCVNLRLGV